MTTCGSARFVPRPTDPAGTPTPPAAGRGQSRPGRRSAAGAERACARTADGPEKTAESSGYACVAGRRLSLMGGVLSGQAVGLPRAPPTALASSHWASFPTRALPATQRRLSGPSPAALRTLHAALRSAAPQDGERSESESIEAAAERRVIDGPLRRHHGTYAGVLGRDQRSGAGGASRGLRDAWPQPYPRRHRTLQTATRFPNLVPRRGRDQPLPSIPSSPPLG